MVYTLVKKYKFKHIKSICSHVIMHILYYIYEYVFIFTENLNFCFITVFIQ